mgnify:CR=1 FL=1
MRVRATLIVYAYITNQPTLQLTTRDMNHRRSGGVECGLLGGRLHEPLWNSVLLIWNAPSARDTSLYRRRRKYRWRLVVKNAYAVHVHSETSNTILSLVCANQSNPHPIIVIVLHLHTNDTDYSRAADMTITVVLAHSQVLDRRWISHCKAQRSFGWPFDQQIVRSTPVLSSWQCNENDTNNTIRDREADTILL